MSFFKNLLKRGQGRETKEAEEPEVPCPHVVLVPQWDSAEDMGKPEKATRYTCQSCNSPFSLEEAKKLMADEAERIRLSEEQD
jgi:hypothetical protein